MKFGAISRSLLAVLCGLAASLCGAVVALAEPSVITLAGTGDRIFNKDQPEALKTNVNPVSMAVHPNTGELYFADADNEGSALNLGTRIRKMSSDGEITTVAGTGKERRNVGENTSQPALTANIYAGRLAFHPHTNELYFIDHFTQIRKLANGVVTTIAGTGREEEFSGEAEALNANIRVNSIVFNPVSGELYFSGHSHLYKIENGNVVTVGGTEKDFFNGDHDDALATNVNSPQNLAFNLDGSGLYFTERVHNIRVLTLTDKRIRTLTGSHKGTDTNVPQWYNASINPLLLTFSPAGELFFLNRENRNGMVSIRRLEADGRVTEIAGTNNSQFVDDKNHLLKVTWIGFHPTSNELYFTDANDHQQQPSLIRRLSNTDRTVTTVTGTGKQQFNGDSSPFETNIEPRLAVFSSTGELYFADGEAGQKAGGSRIRVLRGLATLH